MRESNVQLPSLYSSGYLKNERSSDEEIGMVASM